VALNPLDVQVLIFLPALLIFQPAADIIKVIQFSALARQDAAFCRRFQVAGDVEHEAVALLAIAVGIARLCAARLPWLGFGFTLRDRANHKAECDEAANGARGHSSCNPSDRAARCKGSSYALRPAPMARFLNQKA